MCIMYFHRHKDISLQNAAYNCYHGFLYYFITSKDCFFTEKSQVLIARHHQINIKTHLLN